MKNQLNAKLPVAALSILLLGATVASADTQPMNACLDVVPQVRHVQIGVHDVTVVSRWLCTSKLPAGSYAKLSINGNPASAAIPFTGPTLEQTVRVQGLVLPVKVCVDVEGRDAESGLIITAQECRTVDYVHVDLPRPAFPEPIQRFHRF